MLLALMYHRATAGPRIDKYTNSHQLLFEHLAALKQSHPIVLPGDSLVHKKLSLCLTFDDATFDFYHYVFPMLKQLNLRALLGVPVHYILDSTDIHAQERLSVPYSLMMQEGFYEERAPFCTWQELDEMVQSGYVEIASHSYLHCNLTFNFVDLQREIVYSKEKIEKKLAQPVNSFIYPFGRMTFALHQFVTQHYPYAFRIGSALNFGWGDGSKPLSRISADDLSINSNPLSWWNLTKAFSKALLT
jgi:peptidoglycan/xylan/chitin deacetylase (PgdA/CDA1 family)